MHAIEFAGEHFTALADKALYWERTRTLIASDIHIGKAASFRANGIPVPHGTTAQNLNRLTHLLKLTRAKRLLILGDLYHSADGRSAETDKAFASWRALLHTIHVTLVRGNHDLKAGDPPPELHVECIDNSLEEHGVTLCHEPLPRHSKPFIAGHVHPCFTLSDRFGPSLRVPCFVKSRTGLLLPAFGEFTGMHSMKPQQEDVFYLCYENSVREINFNIAPRRRAEVRKSNLQARNE